MNIGTPAHATSSQLQWIVDAYALVFGGLLPVAGSLGDRAALVMPAVSGSVTASACRGGDFCLCLRTAGMYSVGVGIGRR